MAKWHFEHLRRGKGIRKRRPPAGTVFTWGWHDKTYYGVVLGRQTKDLFVGVIDSDLVCLFNVPHNTPGEDVPWDHFTAQNLLIPPGFVAKTCWTMGFFQEYAHKDITYDELFHITFMDGIKEIVFDTNKNPTDPPYGVIAEAGTSGMGAVECKIATGKGIPPNFDGKPGPVATTPVPSLLSRVLRDYGEQPITTWIGRNGSHLRDFFTTCFEPDSTFTRPFYATKPEEFTEHGVAVLVGCEILAASVGRPALDAPPWFVEQLIETPFIIDGKLRHLANEILITMGISKGDEPAEGLRLLFPEDSYLDLLTGFNNLRSRIMLGIDEHYPTP